MAILFVDGFEHHRNMDRLKITACGADECGQSEEIINPDIDLKIPSSARRTSANIWETDAIIFIAPDPDVTPKARPPLWSSPWYRIY